MSRNADWYLQRWDQALHGDNPCGEDCSFSPEFEAIRDEVEKDGSLHNTSGTNWDTVAQLSAAFLAEQSKDLWVLVYAVWAECQANGLDACTQAFIALRQILSTRWDTLYPLPNRPQRRLAPLVWLCSRIERRAETTQFLDGTSQDVSGLRTELSEFQKLLEEKVGDTAPSFTGIFAKIPETAAPLPDDEPDVTPASVEPAAATVPNPISVSLADMDKDGRIPSSVLPQFIRNLVDAGRQLAMHFLSLDPTDERSYRLSRDALWATVMQAPQTDADGKTQLVNGVPADKVQAYAAAMEGKRFFEILPSLERSACKAPFWFDGHCMVVRCLENLGATKSADCIRESLAALLRRFPELVACKFKDNTPFASAKIHSWLETLQGAPQTAEPVLTTASTSEDTNEEQRLLEAVARSAEEGFQAGLRHLGVFSPGRNRTAILHGILQARYCIAVGNKNAAIHLLTAIYTQMEQWGMLDWEPALTSRILSLLLSSQSKKANSMSDDMLRRLHWLNLDAAVKVSQAI